MEDKTKQEKYKAIQFLREFKQIDGIYYYATSAQKKHFRVFIVVAFSAYLELHHTNLNTSILNRYLEKDIFMKQLKTL